MPQYNIQKAPIPCQENKHTTYIKWQQKIRIKTLQHPKITDKAKTRKSNAIYWISIWCFRHICRLLSKQDKKNQGTVSKSEPKREILQEMLKNNQFTVSGKKVICNIIEGMNPTTCMTDPCDTRFLLRFKETIIDAITMFVNQSLTTGEFLDNWKMAIVRPLIKGPNLDTELKNYRPISNLSFPSKIVEKAAQLQMQEHFDNIHYCQNTKVHIGSIIQPKQHYLTYVTTYWRIWKMENAHQLSALISVLHSTR